MYLYIYMHIYICATPKLQLAGTSSWKPLAIKFSIPLPRQIKDSNRTSNPKVNQKSLTTTSAQMMVTKGKLQKPQKSYFLLLMMINDYKQLLMAIDHYTICTFPVERIPFSQQPDLIPRWNLVQTPVPHCPGDQETFSTVRAHALSGVDNQRRRGRFEVGDKQVGSSHAVPVISGYITIGYYRYRGYLPTYRGL